MQALRTRISLLLLGLCSLVVPPPSAIGGEAIPELGGQITNGGYLVGSENGFEVAYRESDSFIPASTLKLVTALTALEILGPEYRFQTAFFHDRHDRLYISGTGDPFLTSEEVAEIAKALAFRGIREVRELILDDSSFELEGSPPGSANSTNPYDAPSGALAVNFNTLALTRTESGAVLTAEPQTPPLPLMQVIGRQLPAGTHRVNVAAFRGRDGNDQSLRYVAELFCAQLRRHGIATAPRFSRGRPEPQAGATYLHRSRKSVAEVIAACLRYSNNFMANQLLLGCGAMRYGYPATWHKARKAAALVLKTRIGSLADEISVIDGSGLSRANRTTPRALGAVLRELKPHRQLLPIQGGIRLKSGTLSKVFNYAGYFPDSTTPAEFVILLNQAENSRDTVLKHLARRSANR